MKRYTLSELQAMPTLSTGHMEDLKVFSQPSGFSTLDSVKVWLSRMTREDGAHVDNEVIVEHFSNAKGWHTVDSYPAIRSCKDCGRQEDAPNHPTDPNGCPACDGPLI